MIIITIYLKYISILTIKTRMKFIDLFFGLLGSNSDYRHNKPLTDVRMYNIIRQARYKMNYDIPPNDDVPRLQTRRIDLKCDINSKLVSSANSFQTM